jgi:hypothetical protein
VILFFNESIIEILIAIFFKAVREVGRIKYILRINEDKSVFFAMQTGRIDDRISKGVLHCR